MNTTPIKTAVILVNLGTPNAATSKAVKTYLAQFLSDRHVVQIPKAVWLPILHTGVLNLRPQQSARLYQKIWTEEGSPLLVISKKQVEGIKNKLNEINADILLAMRYGHPSFKMLLNSLKKSNIDRILLFPLFPQYSYSTTASVLDLFFTTIKNWKKIPEVRTINHYFNYYDYIQAIADKILHHWEKVGIGEKLLISFHGLPENSIRQGDPYYYQCCETARLIADRLSLNSQQWQVVFQSRFGKQKWLQPYCDVTLLQLAKEGYKNVDIICPGFPSDCLETLEEVSIRYRGLFVAAGGGELRYIPALNDSEEHLQVLCDIILKNLW